MKELSDWFKKCLECKHCYTLQTDELEYHCRKKNGICEYKEYKLKNGRNKKMRINIIIDVDVKESGIFREI